jgi:hydrogenase maturation protein HypF
MIELPFAVQTPTIAFGGDTKCCVYSLHETHAILMGCYDNLEDVQNYRQFAKTSNDICESFGGQPICIAHDLHPSFLTTTQARGLTARSTNSSRRISCHAVQHHHAHVISCAIDNGVTRPVVGIACDGNGYGADGHNWGCEVLVADAHHFTRFGHLEYFLLPGGDAAAVEPWRCALSLLWQAFGGKFPAHIERVFAAVARPRFDAVKGLISHRVASPLTSSLGRLFDAVSFLCGLCEQHCRDGHAAQLLESVAETDCEPYPFFELTDLNRNTIDPLPLIQAVCCDLTEHVGISVIAGRFHASIADALATLALRAADAHKIDTVVLSGGCFMNRLLSELVCAALGRGGVQVLEHHRVPCGDAGLGLGQAVIAATQMAGAPGDATGNHGTGNHGTGNHGTGNHATGSHG